MARSIGKHVISTNRKKCYSYFLIFTHFSLFCCSGEIHVNTCMFWGKFSLLPRHELWVPLFLFRACMTEKGGYQLSFSTIFILNLS